MSAAVPDGFGLVETFGVDFNRTTPTLSDAVLEQDRAYFAQVSGTGTLNPRTRRVFDAEYAALPDGTKLQDSSPSRGFDYGLQLGLDTPAPVNFGGYQSDHVYGTTFTGNNTRLAGQINDFQTKSYANNSGSLSVRVYEQVQLQSLTVADNRHEDRSASATRPAGGGTPTPGIVTLPLDKNGNAPLALSADFGADRYVSQAGLNLNNIRWELRRGGSVVDAGDYSSGTVVDLAGASTTPYELAAWYDADGSGTVNNGEEELAVQVETVQLDTLTLSSTEHSTNAVDKPITGPGEILYVELEDGAPSVPIDLGVTRLTSGPLPQNVEILWSVTGPGVNQIDQTFAGNAATVELTSAGGTYVASVGFDLDGDGALGSNEVAIESEAVVVRVDELVVTESTFTSNTASTPDLTAQTLYVASQSDGTANVIIDAGGIPLTLAAGEHVLYAVQGPSIIETGHFGGEDPTISLPENGGTYRVHLGFDDDGDGFLDGLEVSHFIEVKTFSIGVTVGDGSNVGRNISYAAADDLRDREEYTGHDRVAVTLSAEQSNIPESAYIDRISGWETITERPIPGGKGEVVINADGSIIYQAPDEVVSNLHPETFTVRLLARLRGTDRRSNEANWERVENNHPDATRVDQVTVKPLFDYLSGALFLDDKSLAMRYVNDKYQIVDNALFDSNEFTYSPSETNAGFTGGNLAGNRWVLIGPSAFGSENLLASTIGHENIHYNQPRSVFSGDDSDPVEFELKERPAYQWEIDNAARTGLNGGDLGIPQSWIRFFDGLGPRPL